MSIKAKDLKVAIVCDWLTGIGGAEQVVLELHKMFPKAPLYTSQYDPERINWFNDADVRTTWINKLPKSLKKFLPLLRAYSFSRLDLSEYDLVISSSGAEAKFIKTGPSTTHINYCHSPTHYYWARYESYLKDPGFGALDWLARIGLKLFVGPMRKWDYKAAQRPNYLLANSTFTAQQIDKYYGRKSTVIYPPVDIEKYKPTIKSQKRSGFIITGRQTPYKRIDLAIEACTKLNQELFVIGDGPDNNKLRSLAGPTIKFLGQVSDDIKNTKLQSSEAFIFPGIDDFGISAVEALAAGTPVIAYQAGGALDYINKENGLFFKEQSIEDLCMALETFRQTKFSESAVHLSSEQFSNNKFHQRLNNFIEDIYSTGGSAVTD